MTVAKKKNEGQNLWIDTRSGGKEKAICKLQTETNELHRRLRRGQKCTGAFAIEHQEMKRCEGIMRNLFDDTQDRYIAFMGAGQKTDEKIVELSMVLEF